MISSRITGSSIVAGILYSSLSAIFLIVPLKIFPDLVLGNLLTTIAIVYATWSGLGVFTIALLGYFFFKQTLAWQAIAGLFLIVIGVILVNSFTVKIN